MNDINGIELAVGDNVIYTNRNLNELHKGAIHKITKSKVIVKYAPDNSTVYNGKTYHFKYEHNIMSSDQIMKLG